MMIEHKRIFVGMLGVTVLLAATTAGSAQGSDVTPFTLSVLGPNAGATLPLAQVHSGHGCKGGNVAPRMQWSGTPPDTKSFAITMFDVTANKGAGFWHWVVFDIPNDTRSIDLNQTPKGAKTGRNDFGDIAYGGACPPKGESHQYQFTVWAVRDAMIPFGQGAPDKDIAAFVKTHAVGKADLTFSYQR